MHKGPYTGVAPYATIRMFAIPLGSLPPPDTPIEAFPLSKLAQFDDEDAELYSDVLSHGLDVLNLSFGVSGVVEFYDASAIRARAEQDDRDARPSRPDGQDDPGMGGRQWT